MLRGSQWRSGWILSLSLPLVISLMLSLKFASAINVLGSGSIFNCTIVMIFGDTPK